MAKITTGFRYTLLVAFIIMPYQIFGMDTFSGIFNPRYRTLKVSHSDNFMSIPAIRLGSDEHVIISFDEISEAETLLQYKLIHCNADWQPSRLVESEYVSSFNIDDVEDFAYSENTFVHFVNYRISIPNEHINIIHSGNYLLQVFPRDNPDELILQARFMVYEDTFTINGDFSGRTDKGFNQQWQQLEFTVNTSGITDLNPFQDLSVSVMQNLDERSTRIVKTPLRFEKPVLTYAHKPELIFKAGNEYRRFESVSNAFAGMNIDSLKYMESNYHVWIKEDEPRSLRDYTFDRTQAGRFMVREYNATDSDLGADYITANFTLSIPCQRATDIYVDGEMTHGRFNNSNKLVYDPSRQAYTLSLPLKQGAYNYRYLTAPAGKMPDLEVAASLIEGNKFETLNEYTVCTYYHPVGARADRMTGFTTIRH